MKYLLLSILVSFVQLSFSQTADFLILKKKNKTIERYFTGSNIELTTTNGVYLNANIRQLKNDSLFLREYIVRQVPTNLGIFVLDTLGSYSYKYHYNQIKAIGKATDKKFNLSGSAASLISGGILITIASAVVFVADRKKFSPELMGAGIVLGGLGYLIAKTTGKAMVIGKKYSLIYNAVSSAKKM